METIEVIEDRGGRGALCAVPRGYRDPVLVSGTDGVGTKLLVAIAAGRHSGVGIDLVAMCANDVVVCGAQPLLFTAYFAAGALEPGVAEEVRRGITEGCQQAGCAFVGGAEVEELPELYRARHYDLAGCCYGVVERARVEAAQSAVRPGDVVLGLASTGFHSNGYSLLRRALLGPESALQLSLDDEALRDALLRPTRIYVRAVLAAYATGQLRACAHITGGGLVENPPRVLPAGVQMHLRSGSWPEPPLVQRLHQEAGVPLAELRRTFNLGIGMVLVAAPAGAAAVRDACEAAGEAVYPIGVIEDAAAPTDAPRVVFMKILRPVPIGVLVSGRGSNLQALLDAQRAGELEPARVAVVIANQAGAQALQRAEAAGVPARLVEHRRFGADRAAFEDALLVELRAHQAEYVVLAGFMRLLSGRFLQAYPDRVLNIHPSLLPAFPGVRAAAQAVQYGARVSGCTAHLVDEGCDTGPILLQAAVPVLPEDDEAALAARILQEEHRLLPEAVRLLTRGQVAREGRRLRADRAS